MTKRHRCRDAGGKTRAGNPCRRLTPRGETCNDHDPEPEDPPPQEHRCGDSGGKRADGEPCRQIVGEEGARCHSHPKQPGGRPRVELKLSLEQIEELAELKMTHEEIAHLAGVSEATFRRRLENDPEVLSAYQRGVAKAHQEAKSRIRKHIKSGNITMLIFYAKTQLGWSEKQIHELTGAGGGPIETKGDGLDLTQLSDAELAALETILTKAGGRAP